MGGSYDLHSIVRNLRSNKITDRKRAFSALRSALKDQSILASLDKNTLDKVSLTWDLVAGNIAKVIEQELNKSTGHGKSRVAGPDVLAAVMLLRTVVQLANRRQSLLNPRKMLEHVQRVLAGGPWEQQLQVQYTRLLRLLLLLDGWQATLPPSLYHGLVEGVCQLLRSDKEDTDVVALSSTLHHLVTLGFYQEDACLETVLRTLAGSFAKIRETGTASQVVLQLSSLVEVGRRLGARRRRLLCTLGEPLVRTLLLLGTWNSPQIKVLSLEFLALQLSLHRTSDADQSGWQCLLRDWHHLLMQQLQEASVLNQQELRVRRAQVWLAAETLHQLEPSGTALHTAVAALVAAKSLGRDVLPRLEVLACYLWKYPETAGHMLPSLQKLLEFLTQCYSSSKLLDVKRCVLRCYHGVAHALVAGQRPPWPLWNVVWEQTAKTVFLNQCVEEGHLVLQELLRKQLAACSDLGSLFCPGRPLEPSALRSLCVTLCQATHVDALLPEKHRWRLWLLELPATVQLGSALVMGAELLAALCLARPATALASQYSPPQVWQDPYPWRAILDADLERRTTAVPRTESGAKDTGSWHKSPVTVVETAWEATLDTLAKQGLAFLDSIETLPACLCSGAMGAILLTHMWRLQVRPALFDSPLVQQLQSCLRDCTEKLVHQQQCWKDAAWLCLLEALLSYVEGGPAPACAWLLGALPQELDDCLLTTLRATPDCIGDDIGVRPHGDVTEGCHVDSDEWADDSLPSSSVASSQGSSGDDFEFADTGQPVCYDMAATVLSPDRLTQEETQQLAVLRIALSYFCLGRRAAAAAGGALDLLLQLLEEAARGLSAWSIQAALQVLRMLLERAELLNEAELFSLVDALRELMKVHCRQLDVSAALLELARLCVPALNRRVAGTELRHCFLVVLDAYTALLSQGILNEAVSLAFLRLLLECLQEPSSSWVRLTVDGQPVSVLQYTLRFLGSSHDSVRTLAAENMAVFLRGQQPASLQALLPLLYKHLEADVSREDEHHSGCLVFATALANAAIALGPHLGGTATALVLQAVRDRGLPDTLAAKVLGFAHADPWAEVHLPAVVYHWLRRGLPLAELPVSALGCSSATQFWKCHWVRVLPAVVECCHSRAVQLVSDSVSIPARELLRQVAPSVLSRALPSSEPLRFLQEHLSPEVVEQVFVDHLPEVLVSVLQLACDLPTHATPHDDQYPPCLGEGQVQECLQLLERKCCGDLLAVLLRKRDGVQLVLEGLQQCAGPRLAALKHLVAMVSLALARPTGLGGSECFVLRTLTRQLLRKLPVQGGADDTVRLVARLLRQLYEASLVYKEAARNLPLIINALAPFVDDKNTAVEVQRLVQILLSDEKLEAAAMLVLPRCCHGSLDAVQLRLKQGLVTQVLAVFTQSLKQDLLSGHEDIGTLVALGSLLKERRADLLMDTQGKLFFTEAASSSPLHQLVVVLFQQARSPHRQVREASLHCLGILGPIEWHLPCLSTAHWNPISGMVDEPTKGCRHISYAIIFRTMERYLSHPDAKLSRVACQVLKCALATPAGFSFASQHGQAEDMEDTFAFLHPFVPSQCKVSPLERPLSATDLSRLELWAPEEACDHATWITNLVCTLIRCCNDHILWALLPLCSMAVDLCELLFPLVVETLSDEGSYWSAVVSGMAIFLDHHAEAQVKDEAQRSQSTVVSEPMSTELTSGLVYCCQSSVAVMMSAVERMVVRRDAKARTLWEGLRLGCVNFLRAAQAAEFCGHHVTAVQCVELWWDSLARPCDDGGAPFLHWSAAEAAPVQSVLLSSLSGLGDLDALTGCRCLALGGPAHLLLWRHWAEQQGGHWPTLLAQADLAATGRNARLGHALKQCGLYHTLAAYLEPSTPDLAELQAECAWRLANWDCQLSHDDHGCGHMGLHRGIFMTLSSMSSQDTEELCSGLKACRELLSSRFSAMTQLGSTLQLNQLLAKMQMCTVLEECAALLCGNEDEAVLLARWEQRAAQPAVHFDVAEPVLWLQSVVLGQLHSLQADAARTSILRHYAVHARINQRLALARVALQQLECCAPDQASRWLLEEARIQLAHGDCTEAQHTLWTLLRQLSQQHEETGGVTRAYAEVLQLYGECLAESHLESSDTIAREYLDKAVQLLSGRAEDALWAAHLRLAQFADSQLQSMEQYLHSPEFRAKQELLQQSSHILDCTQSSGKRTSIEEARALRLLERQSNLDRGEAASLEAVRRRHLLQAIDNYLQCLRGGHSLRLFRLVSLWIANATAPEVNALLQQGLRKLESHKFVPLIYQLAARMSRPDGSTFPGLLFQLIERVVRDHPYQTLPVVLALCNADRDPTATIPRAAKKAKTSPTEDRVEGARYLVLQLRKGGGLCSSILGPLERLMDAYIHLAYLDPPGVPRGQTAVRLPRDTPLLKLGPMDRVPVLTQNVEVDHSASYCNLPGILRFSAEYRLCGGINKPKVITCVSQDGSEYKQLVKGRDDLRQDAVMQQAFGLVNCLLAHDPTATGRLAMRTYKVVPLSRRSGLVQWCEGTQPFSEFLLTPHTGAHQRYQPHDWTPVACRNAMQEVHKGSPEERLHVYQEVCSHFHPVFRYFFFEQFPEPSRWFERRRAYIHSVATGSIVGYVLGLGDRHCANILVDKHSAELIHIDLGVAFEQGRVLNTPETVPFRLTRDVVDGMGICGVEGTFRRCCERTMEVMRASRELLVTVVEVLLHDPLSSWTLSPERVAALQADGDALPPQRPSPELPYMQGDNRLARRMLLRLEQKLRGLEEGAPLSVAGQVNLLIQQARDPHNLSRLFPGWQPYV